MNPYEPPAVQNPHQEKSARQGVRIIMLAVIPGFIADLCYGMDAYRIYNYSKRLIPWGGIWEDIIGYTFIISVGMLFVGVVLCLQGLPSGRSWRGVVIGIVCTGIHAAVIYYARHILFSIP